MFEIYQVVNEGEPVLKAKKNTHEEARSTAAHLSLDHASTMFSSLGACDIITVRLTRWPSIERLCSNAKHVSAYVRYTIVEGRK